MKTAPIESRPSLSVGRYWTAKVMLVFLAVALSPTPLLAQQVQAESRRKALQKVAPSYPAIARTLRLTGAVRLVAKVAPNGKVVSAEVLGGHPVLAKAATDAVLQWRYEAAPQPSDEMVVINFQP